MDATPDARPTLQQLQAEAESYQSEYLALRSSLQQIEVNLGHNRRRGLALIRRMRACGVSELAVDQVLLRPCRDDKGFDRIKLPDPARTPHA